MKSVQTQNDQSGIIQIGDLGLSQVEKDSFYEKLLFLKAYINNKISELLKEQDPNLISVSLSYVLNEDLYEGLLATNEIIVSNRNDIIDNEYLLGEIKNIGDKFVQAFFSGFSLPEDKSSNSRKNKLLEIPEQVYSARHYIQDKLYSYLLENGREDINPRQVYLYDDLDIFSKLLDFYLEGDLNDSNIESLYQEFKKYYIENENVFQDRFNRTLQSEREIDLLENTINKNLKNT